jgi:SRSO17 transposase
VQRQYTGTAGRIENAQVGVYLAYATPRGYAFLDRALYLPRVWAADPARREVAGVPEHVAFATKPTLARRMIEQAVTGGVPARWVTGDEVYGADPALRAAVAAHGLGYVLAVAKNHRVTTGIGPRRAVDLAVRPDVVWHRSSCGAGAKGERDYDWAWITVPSPGTGSPSQQQPGQHGLLIRRGRRTGELAFYRTYSPSPVPLRTLIRVAGTRWRIEESFQSSKELTGLDQHQVRTWTSWHRWTALVMLAHAFLSIMTAEQAPASDVVSDRDVLAPLTRNEIRRLLTSLITRDCPGSSRGIRHALAWSRWRRRHQARARAAHYNRRAQHDE